MGQLALGFRSLFIKLAIFFVMAALLAWALGGTLWPRPEVTELEPVSFDGRDWYWRLSVSSGRDDPVRWCFMVRDAEGREQHVDERTWVEVAGPVASDGTLYFAGRATFNPDERWRLARITAGRDAPQYTTMPDRLAVERQLARIRVGLEPEDPQRIDRIRSIVLDPPVEQASAGP
jgi:hypothetical protein